MSFAEFKMMPFLIRCLGVKEIKMELYVDLAMVLIGVFATLMLKYLDVKR